MQTEHYWKGSVRRKELNRDKTSEADEMNREVDSKDEVIERSVIYNKTVGGEKT